MNWKNTSEGYGLISLLFHWLLAIALLGLFVLGVWMVELSYYDPWYHQAPAIHKSVGIAVVVLMLIRWGWHRYSPPPLPLAGSSIRVSPRLIQRLHGVMYVWVLLIGIAGYLISTGEGEGIDVIAGIELPALPWQWEGQVDEAGWAHKWLAYGFMGVVFVHAMAALKHHFWDKDDTLKRMTRIDF